MLYCFTLSFLVGLSAIAAALATPRQESDPIKYPAFPGYTIGQGAYACGEGLGLVSCDEISQTDEAIDEAHYNLVDLPQSESVMRLGYGMFNYCTKVPGGTDPSMNTSL